MLRPSIKWPRGAGTPGAVAPKGLASMQAPRYNLRPLAMDPLTRARDTLLTFGSGNRKERP
jgi:hypothetical protein